MDEIVAKIFLECARAVEAGECIQRYSATDKEYSFQNWFAQRLASLKINFDEPARNIYPDFRLVDYPLGFEIKGLGFPGRETNYDCNSQVPSGHHHGRHVWYVFGRYPAQTKDAAYPVYDLVFCHGNFLNADSDYVHKNKNLKGFGSYGDIMIRDRKMYVAPTPYALVEGTERQVTLIAPENFHAAKTLKSFGTLARVEAEKLIKGYRFDMKTHALKPDNIPNPNAGKKHLFTAFRAVHSTGPLLKLR